MELQVGPNFPEYPALRLSASEQAGWSRKPYREIGLGGLGALNEYEAVGHLQRVINGIQIAAAANPATMVPFRSGLAALEEDNTYATKTHAATRALADWLTRQGWCSRTSGTEVERNGPNAIRDCLMTLTGVNLFRSDEIDDLQRAWTEWKESKGEPPARNGGPPPAGDRVRVRRDMDVVPPVSEPAGWFGLILFAADLGIGAVLAGTSKKW